ncbi:MAG TPA: S53 family peptidase [Solirubrobacteraceae bacterium]|nr:S53 family peptidase [Solirubrobacteraceae bacterium]
MRVNRSIFASAVALLVCALGPSPAQAEGPLPLSPAAYEASHVCAVPPPGYSGCMALRLVPDDPSAIPGTETTPQTIEHTEPLKGALTPAMLTGAYGVSGAAPPSTQTIALVDAYDDATIAADLETFSKQYGLPACNEANGCFRKVNQNGKPGNLPPSSGAKERAWAQEIALDVETTHAVCPACRIVLVEAKTNANLNLFEAEETAVALGAQEISNSWGGPEATADSASFNHPGIVITASSGDFGYLDWTSGKPAEYANYPASSPHVIAVGGTRLKVTPAKSWESETVWNDGGASNGQLEGAGASGGGCSGHFAADSWQLGVPDWTSVGCGGARSVTDISAVGDPYTGVSIYNSTESPEGEKGWTSIGGTSASSPIVASIFALAGGAQGYAYPAQMLYENAQQNPASLHDVTVGSNGECLKKFHEKTGASGCTTAEQATSCAAQLRCLAAPGYDGPSGLGTPNGLAAFRPPGTSEGGQATVTGAPEAPSPAATEPPPTGTSSPGASDGRPSVAPAISGLKLTHAAIAALRKRARAANKLGFAFSLNVPARVRVTLARRVRVHGRMRWRTVSTSSSFSAAGGAQTRQLGGRAVLPRGRYVLTVAAEHGGSKSIVFQIG